RPYINIGRSYGCDVEAVFFDVPLEICRQRNRLRERIVPDEAMEMMGAKLIVPSVGEGFRRVSVISY
ncbi:MAG: ATP-binding protein, partial [Acidobacteriota bacterium]|nr:ATP-binding protein [Acidobacteriota bacterium]